MKPAGSGYNRATGKRIIQVHCCACMHHEISATGRYNLSWFTDMYTLDTRMEEMPNYDLATDYIYVYTELA